MPPTVFIVDDDEMVRESLAVVMRANGLTVELFQSAEDFLQTDAPTRQGCLILDVALPGMSGLKLMQNLRSRRSDVEVIVLTARGDVPAVIRSFKQGARDFFEKPCDTEALLCRTRELLERMTRPPRNARRQWNDSTESHEQPRKAHVSVL